MSQTPPKQTWTFPLGAAHRAAYEADANSSSAAHPAWSPSSAAHPAWFARPPKNGYDAPGDKACDCFYAHPTTAANPFGWNVGQQAYARGGKLTGFAAGTPDLMETQASAVGDTCNLWVPHYSQVGMLALGASKPGTGAAKLRKFEAAMRVAYADLAGAFHCFLRERPDKSRPFIILAHSQGSILMVKVIKECLAGTEHEHNMVAAYLAGGYLPKDVVPLLGGNLHVSTGPLDHGCVMSWDTRIKGKFDVNGSTRGVLGLAAHHLYWSFFDHYCVEPTSDEDQSKPRVQVNPLTWAETAGAGDGYLGSHALGRDAPEVAVAPDWEAGVGFADGVSAGHFLWVAGAEHMKDPGPAAGVGNLHPADVTLWFYNIKKNVAKRVQAFVEARAGVGGSKA